MAATGTRVQWVDAAKGVGIVLVVFGHVWRGLHDAGLIPDGPVFERLDAAIYLFHMPLFFMLSGLFFESGVKRRGLLQSIPPRIENLLYPLVIWSWVLAASKLIAGDAASNPVSSWWDVLTYPFPPRDIFWFLWAMFVIQMLASILVLADKQWAYAAGAIGAVALCIVAPPSDWPYLASVVVEFLPYFLIGMVLSSLGRDAAPSRDVALLSIVGFVATQALLWLLPSAVFDPAAGTGLAVRLVACVGAFVSLAWLGARLPAALLRIFVFLGTSSLAIYVMHTIVAAAARTILLKLGIQSLAIHIVAETAAGIGLPCLALIIADRLRLRRSLGLGRNTLPLERAPSDIRGAAASRSNS